MNSHDSTQQPTSNSTQETQIEPLRSNKVQFKREIIEGPKHHDIRLRGLVMTTAQIDSTTKTQQLQ
jgi:hypothetical protein